MGVPACLFFFKVEFSFYSLLPPEYVFTKEDILYNWTAIPYKIINDEVYFKVISILVCFYILIAYYDMIIYYYNLKIPK